MNYFRNDRLFQYYQYVGYLIQINFGETKANILDFFLSFFFKMTTQLLTQCQEISLAKDVDYQEVLVKGEIQVLALKK